MKDRLVQFELFGQEFAFYSDAPDDEVEKAINLLRDELEGDEHYGRSHLPSSKMLVLGCLRLAAKYVQMEQEHAVLYQEQSRSIANLIRKMTASIE